MDEGFGEGKHLCYETKHCVRGIKSSHLLHGVHLTRGEVIGLVARLALAVQFLLSQLLQETLVLILLTGLRCPLLDKLGSAACTVTLMVWE